MPYIMVGDGQVQVSWPEYFFSILREETPIEWKGNREETSVFEKSHCHESGIGIFRYAWWYDGVIAEIESGGKRFPIMSQLRSRLRVRRLRDMSRLNEQGMHGDGI